jgi:FkbM family methyltransferase
LYPLKHFAIQVLSRQRNLRRAASLFRIASRSLGLGGNPSLDESGETHFLSRYLPAITAAAPVVFDVGANRGEYALAVLSIRSDARVVAFEPNPELAEVLLGIDSPHLEIVRAACADAEGETILYSDAQESGSGFATLVPVTLSLHNVRRTAQYKVQALTLDNFMRRKDISTVDLLKIDAEGYELKILSGIAAALARRAIRCVQFEFNAGHALARVFLRDFLDVLPGYDFFRLAPHGLVALGAYRPETWELFFQQNIVALQPDAKAAMERRWGSYVFMM